ncbi:hypothetical protein GCM10009021_28840 [Halarchaeum nitratireducens]|uniref:Uncharacterized protein n=1 Tax=Halarchaeum nitratireducens TaxID=489913 RepID=A0A830GG04_9EURY|nr:hypothetical protein GCM10009021_28840 [Halarchaeum nitratireducens]
MRCAGCLNFLVVELPVSKCLPDGAVLTRRVGGRDHGSVLRGGLEGDAIVSSQDLPPQVNDVGGLIVLSKAGKKNYIASRYSGAKETVERLVLSFGLRSR